MSLKQELQEIAGHSKIVFNMALIHATNGEHDKAVALFDQAIALDSFLAVAYFQSGVSQFLLGRFDAAGRDFSDALALFRDNHTIDYEQLGLKFKLFSCEVRFNRGLALIHMGRLEEGMQDLVAARNDKQSSEHDVIDEACTDQAVGYTVFSIPVGVLFRPSDTKLQNLETRDYLGKAKVIAATNSNDLFIGFSGAKKLAATAGVCPPDGFVRVGQQGPRARRSNTGDGRLEHPVDVHRASPPSPPKSRAPGLLKLGRSRSTRAPAPAAELPMAPTATSSRNTTMATRLRSKATPIPTPPSSVASAQDEQVFPPKGLLHARSNSSGLNGSSRQHYPDHPTPPRGDGFSVPARPIRPAEDLRSPMPAASLRKRRGHEPAPLAPITPLVVVPAEPPVDRDAAAQAPERVASWAQGLRARHERSASSPSALPTTPQDPAAPALSRNMSQSGRSALAYVAEDNESVDGAEPFALARYASVARSYSQAPLRASKVRLSERGGQEDVPPRRTSAIEMLASEARDALRLSASPTQLAFGGPHVGDAAQPQLPPALGTAGKIRVKLRYHGETRALNMAPDTALGEFVERVRRKFSSETNLPIKYRDSDGSLVSILDADDWECAMDSARDQAAGGTCGGKLEVVVGEGE